MTHPALEGTLSVFHDAAMYVLKRTVSRGVCCSGTALTDDSTINTTSQLVLGETGSCCCPHAALPGETLVRLLIANKLIICSYLMNSSSCDD